MSWARAQQCSKSGFRTPVTGTNIPQQPHDAEQRSDVDFFFPRLVLLMGNWHVYTATGHACPPVVGMKPAHLHFVLQLSQTMCDYAPMCERTEFVLLGDPQGQRCQTNLCAKPHC